MTEIHYEINQYIEDRIEDELAWYSAKASSNKKWYYGLVSIQIVLAAMIPFVTLFSDIEITKYMIALLATIVTIVSGALSTFQYQKKWIEYRTTSETIKHEKFMFLSKINPYNLKNRNSVLVKRIEALISKENTSWSFYAQNINSESEEDN